MRLWKSEKFFFTRKIWITDNLGWGLQPGWRNEFIWQSITGLIASFLSCTPGDHRGFSLVQKCLKTAHSSTTSLTLICSEALKAAAAVRSGLRAVEGGGADLQSSPTAELTHTMVAGPMTGADFWGQTDSVNVWTQSFYHITSVTLITHSWNVLAAEVLFVGGGGWGLTGGAWLLRQRLLEVGGDAPAVGAGGTRETARRWTWTLCGWEREEEICCQTHGRQEWHLLLNRQSLAVRLWTRSVRTHGGLTAGFMFLLILLNTGSDEGALSSRRGGEGLAEGGGGDVVMKQWTLNEKLNWMAAHWTGVCRTCTCAGWAVPADWRKRVLMSRGQRSLLLV